MDFACWFTARAYGYKTATGASTHQVLCWGAENLSVTTSDSSRLRHGDITSLSPPRGNEGYERNRDVPCLSVTTSYVMTTLGVHGKRHNLNPIITLRHWKSVDKQPSVRQILCKGRNLPSANSRTLVPAETKSNHIQFFNGRRPFWI